MDIHQRHQADVCFFDHDLEEIAAGVSGELGRVLEKIGSVESELHIEIFGVRCVVTISAIAVRRIGIAW